MCCQTLNKTSCLDSSHLTQDLHHECEKIIGTKHTRRKHPLQGSVRICRTVTSQHWEATTSQSQCIPEADWYTEEHVPTTSEQFITYVLDTKASFRMDEETYQYDSGPSCCSPKDSHSYKHNYAYVLKWCCEVYDPQHDVNTRLGLLTVIASVVIINIQPLLHSHNIHIPCVPCTQTLLPHFFVNAI